MKQSILYISYDGMLEPLGQSQVLAYLKHLAKEYHIHLISFEKIDDWKKTKERQQLRKDIIEADIFWHPLRYHKKPSALATAWDISIGFLLGLVLVLRYKIKIVHARSYVSSVIALAIKRITGIAFLFDMRGFWADERVDGGLWDLKNPVYKSIFNFFKKKEKEFLYLL